MDDTTGFGTDMGIHNNNEAIRALDRRVFMLENIIQQLLAERAMNLGQHLVGGAGFTPSNSSPRSKQ